MATIKELYRRVLALNTDDAIEQAVSETADEYLKENQKQLFEGFDREGQHLRRYRSAKYARVKNQMNPLPGLGNPDFYVTGDFYRGQHVRATAQGITTDLTDPKSAELLRRDPNIIGLGGAYRMEYIGVLHPALVRRIRQNLKL